MKIQAHIEKENKTRRIEIDDGCDLYDLLKELGINPVTVIVSRDDEIIIEKDTLHDGDAIKIISVISGG